MSDLEWEFIKAVLPNKTRGYDRRLINGIYCVLGRWLRTRISCADLPGEHCLPTPVFNRYNWWSYTGRLERIMDAIADAENADTVMVGGTSVRPHHSATTLKKEPAPLSKASCEKALSPIAV